MEMRKFNSRTPVILVSAKQGAGRKTLVDGLGRLLRPENVSLYPVRFAEPLYHMHDKVLSVLGEDLKVKNPPEKDGPLLQLLGHEWLRTYDAISAKRYAYGANVIANRCRGVVDDWYQAQESSMFPAVLIIPDCHYIEEFDAFPDAIRVRLQCDRDTRKERTPINQWRITESHISEVALDTFASMGRFDLTIDTGYHDADTVAALVFDHMRQSQRKGEILGLARGR